MRGESAASWAGMGAGRGRMVSAGQVPANAANPAGTIHGPMSDRDRQQIRDLIENWAVWRDAGDWERFRTVWHDDATMMATWFQGPAVDFIRVSREGFDRGVRILHFLGGTSIDVNHDRAIAQTKITISQLADDQTVICDVVCPGRLYEFLEKRAVKGGIVLRQPIYEKD